PHTPEKSRASERAALHHCQPPYPARPVGAAGSLYRPALSPDRNRSETRYDCPAGVRAVSGDPRHWQTQAIAGKDETSGLGIGQVFILSSSLFFVGHNPPSRVKKTALACMADLSLRSC